MLKGGAIKGRGSCPPAHIHQPCVAFDAPNLLIFVRGSIKIHSSGPSHLFLFDSLLSCTQCVYCLPRPLRPLPRPPQLQSPSAPGPSTTMITAEPAPSKAPVRTSPGWGELPSTGKKDWFSFVHKITTNKLQITQDTFIIDLCKGA